MIVTRVQMKLAEGVQNAKSKIIRFYCFNFWLFGFWLK